MARAGRKRKTTARQPNGQPKRETAKEIRSVVHAQRAKVVPIDTAPDDEVWRIVWADYGLPYCGVYVVTPESKWPCKVGMTSDMPNRLAQIQTSLWMPVTVSGYRWCADRETARTIEQHTHERLADRRLFGEWFDIRHPEALSEMEDVALQECLGLHSGVPAGRDDITEVLEDLIFYRAVSSVRDPQRGVREYSGTLASSTGRV